MQVLRMFWIGEPFDLAMVSVTPSGALVRAALRTRMAKSCQLT